MLKLVRISENGYSIWRRQLFTWQPIVWAIERWVKLAAFCILGAIARSSLAGLLMNRWVQIDHRLWPSKQIRRASLNGKKAPHLPVWIASAFGFGVLGGIELKDGKIAVDRERRFKVKRVWMWGRVELRNLLGQRIEV